MSDVEDGLKRDATWLSPEEKRRSVARLSTMLLATCRERHDEHCARERLRATKARDDNHQLAQKQIQLQAACATGTGPFASFAKPVAPGMYAALPGANPGAAAAARLGGGAPLTPAAAAAGAASAAAAAASAAVKAASLNNPTAPAPVVAAPAPVPAGVVRAAPKASAPATAATQPRPGTSSDHWVPATTVARATTVGPGGAPKPTTGLAALKRYGALAPPPAAPPAAAAGQAGAVAPAAGAAPAVASSIVVAHAAPAAAGSAAAKHPCVAAAVAHFIKTHRSGREPTMADAAMAAKEVEAMMAAEA